MIDLTNEELRRALVDRDMGAVFRLLVDGGMVQRELAVLVGMSQSEVSEVLTGRRVMAYDVLVRIAEGLGVPRGMMGLGYSVGVLPQVEKADEAGDEAMKRRALVAVGAAALFGAPVLGEVLAIAAPERHTPLPTRIGQADVAAVRKLTEGLRAVARTYGGCSEQVTAVAERSRDLLPIEGADDAKAGLRLAVAELHTLAGWCCVDAGYADNARAHFATAMDLGDVGGSLRHAGIQMVDSGAYNDGLKAFQLALFQNPDDEWLHGETAVPLAAMGHQAAALDAVKRFREPPQATLFDDADRDYVCATVFGWLGRTDTAQALVESAVRKWDQEATANRDRVEADILFASLHVVAGDSVAPQLARKAIAGVAPLRSVRSRVKLRRLVTALESRSDSTSRDLAGHARSVVIQQG